MQQNAYDGEGRRVVQTTNAGSLLYQYSGLALIYEKNLTSGQVTDRYYANGLQLAKSVSGVGTFYFISDALGSIRLTTSSTGGVTFSTNYEPFGINYNVQGNLEALMYTDKQYNTSTGLYYYGARFYNPSIARFMTEDFPAYQPRVSFKIRWLLTGMPS